MKLNLGCGYNKLPGYINVDHDPICKPDVVADLEATLPFEANTVDEIVLHHVLEHLGQTTETYFSVWKEFYRILKDQAVIKITVPHWQHDNFHHDPTHVRKVTPVGVDMFSQSRNMNTIKTNGNETTLGLQLGIDISVTDVGYDIVPEFQQQIASQPKNFLENAMVTYNNVCYQIQIHAKAHKPARSTL